MPTTLRCDPKLFEKDLSNQVVVVTGANSGCGLETTLQLCKQNATVILACRSEEKAKEALEEVGENGKFIRLDLADLSSVKTFVDEFTKSYNRLDMLINNAGVMACPHSTTKDGFEMQFGCNHLGHFALTKLLTPLLLETAKKTKVASRVIILSSVAAADMTMSSGPAKIFFDDLNWKTTKYDAFKAYQQSKLANYLHAMELSKKYPHQLIAVSVHPGWVRSNLDHHVLPSNIIGNCLRNLFQWAGQMIPAVDGAQTTLHCALSDPEKLENGSFYSQFGVYKDKASKKGGWPMELPNPNATEEAAEKLWIESEKLVDIPVP